MPISLQQSQTFQDMATLLYSFLPGSGSNQWKGHVSFQTVARDVGIANYWPGGSKQSAIIKLLEQTFGQRPQLFERLVLAIVKNGMTYRQKSGKPVRCEEIESLNGLLLQLSFRFSDLWSPDFLASLEGDGVELARERARSVTRVEEQRPAVQAKTLDDLRTLFYELAAQQDRQAAGLSLEKLLNDLFQLSKLEPRAPFRVVGEQIDGSFLLDNETYLLEAKWEKEPLPEADLLVFRGKVEGKSQFTRGVLISLSRATQPALDAIKRGKQPNFMMVDGDELVFVLEGQLDLPTLLRLKWRSLTEEGNVFVSIRDLIAVTSGKA